MTLFQFPVDSLDRLRAVLDPRYYMGFLHACIHIELQRAEPDTEILRLAVDERESFIRRQRVLDENDGLLPQPVFWTDVDPDNQTPDEDEIAGMAPSVTPFLLCSSVEPHARWAAKLYADDDVLTFYRNREEAEADCAEAIKEGQRQRAEIIESAFAACRVGNIVEVARILDTATVDEIYLNCSINHQDRTLRIEDRTEPFGDPEMAEPAPTAEILHETTARAPHDVVESPSFVVRGFFVPADDNTSRPDDGA